MLQEWYLLFLYTTQNKSKEQACIHIFLKSTNLLSIKNVSKLSEPIVIKT